MKRLLFPHALAAAALLLAPPLALAGSPVAAPQVQTSAAPSNDGWWFRAAPYVWLTAVSGNATLGSHTVPVNVSMSDTLDNLDMGFMGLFEVGKGRWSAGIDVIYAKLSENVNASTAAFNSFRFEQSQWILTPQISYRVIDRPRYQMSAFAGARIQILGADLTGRLRSGGELEASRDTSWIDPIIGFRGQAELGDSFFFRYYGDIGGFGASSELTWQAFAGFGWKFNASGSLLLGYRALGDDYQPGSFGLDTVTHGPVIGVEFRF